MQQWSLFLSGEVSIRNVEVSPFPSSTAFVGKAKATEFLRVWFQPDYDAQSQHAYDASFQELLAESSRSVQGFISASTGWEREETTILNTGEKAKEYIMLAGWESRQAHMEFSMTELCKEKIPPLETGKST